MPMRAHRRRRWPLTLAALLLPLGACGFLQRRAVDFDDCLLYRCHDDALGLSATAKVGPLAATLGGWYANGGWGKDTFWQRPGAVLTNHGTGIPFTTLGPLAYGQSWSRLLAFSSWGNHPGDPNAFDDTSSWLGVSDVFDLDDALPFRLSPAQRIADLFGVEVGLVPLFWSGHVGFNFAEFADFLLGWVGLDVLGDDGAPRPRSLPYVPPGE